MLGNSAKCFEMSVRPIADTEPGRLADETNPASRIIALEVLTRKALRLGPKFS
jgi:hypothetical protein